jgi:xylulokinase
MHHIVSLDLGTTYFKAALVDHEGRFVGLVQRPAPVTHPEAGRWEIAPVEFKSLIRDMLCELAQQEPTRWKSVACLSFSTQTNSFVLLDENDEPLTPVILWPDRRARADADLDESMQRVYTAAGTAASCGLPRLNHQHMVAKLHWLARCDQTVWSQTRHVCLLSDYLTLWATGRHVTEASVIGFTGLLNIWDLQWNLEACQLLDLKPWQLPHVVRAGEPIGRLTRDFAQLTGLPDSCVFVAGCLDQYAGAIGAANVAPGVLSETTGTVLTVLRCLFREEAQEAATSAKQTYLGPSFEPDRFFQMVVSPVSAGLLERYIDTLPHRPPYSVLEEAAASVGPGADGLSLDLKAPAHGEHVPLVGWKPFMGPGHGVRAIMEAVASALKQSIIELGVNNDAKEVRNTGGAARNTLWLQIKADTIGLPMRPVYEEEPACLGAAVIAGGWLLDQPTEQLAREWVKFRPVIEPSVPTR